MKYKIRIYLLTTAILLYLGGGTLGVLAWLSPRPGGLFKPLFSSQVVESPQTKAELTLAQPQTVMVERAPQVEEPQEKRGEDPELREKIREAFRATLAETSSREKREWLPGVPSDERWKQSEPFKGFVSHMPRADEPMVLEILPVPPTGTLPPEDSDSSWVEPTAVLGPPAASWSGSPHPANATASSPEPPTLPTEKTSWAQPVSAVVSPTQDPRFLGPAGLSASSCFANLEMIPPWDASNRKISKPRKTGVQPLTGTYFGSLHDRCTLVLSEEVRQQLGKVLTVLLTPGPDHCLWLTSPSRRGRVIAHLENSVPGGPEAQKARRLFFAQTEKVALSPDGRLLLPPRLVDYAGLSCELTVIGMDDYFEIWDSQRWQQYSRSHAGPVKTAPQNKATRDRWSRL